MHSTHSSTKPSDWYRITRKAIPKQAGWRIWHYYKSLEEALKALYPEVNWDPSKFEEEAARVKDGHWKDKENLFRALERVERKLDIKEVNHSLLAFPHVTKIYSPRTGTP